ncbi:MAG TPA: SH3 domain-containing protein [Pirellulales bacterium]|nr:SH3 domain-containing protein [Pirellulales bacterium]
MALRLAIWVLVGLWGVVLHAGDEFPYVAYVNAANVYVRSGPGENYYPVLKLPKGRKVEVYRHDPGGWYAIRPPEDSFSWVSAEFIEPTRGKLARVKGERVVARVGSKFSDIRDVIQVRLDQGEEVEVLEAKRFNSGPAAQTWYKIAPPAGEFRWVSGRFVDREPPEDSRRAASPENNLLIAGHAGGPANEEEMDEVPLDGAGPRVRDDVEEAIYEYEEDDEEGDDFPPSGAKAAGHEVRVPRERPIRDTDDEREPAPMVAERGPAIEHSRRWLNGRAAASTTEELDELELALASVLADEPSQWDFRPLAARAKAALERAETPLDRGRLRRYLRKLSEYSDLQWRHLAVMGPGGSAGRALARVDKAAEGAQRAVTRGDARARFDGVGRLTQVVSRDSHSPRYALLDNRGQVVCYVTPTPGVNLRRYLNQDVGVNGTLGFLQEQNATHVTARRVVSVEGPTLR